jgi:hypothetical protein
MQPPAICMLRSQLKRAFAYTISMEPVMTNHLTETPESKWRTQIDDAIQTIFNMVYFQTPGMSRVAIEVARTGDAVVTVFSDECVIDWRIELPSRLKQFSINDKWRSDPD